MLRSSDIEKEKEEKTKDRRIILQKKHQKCIYIVGTYQEYSGRQELQRRKHETDRETGRIR